MSGPPPGRILVMLVDDDRLVRETFGDLFRAESDFDVAGAAADAEQAVAVAGAERPDVAVVDVKMPGGGPAATRGIIAVSRGTRVLAMSAYDDPTSVREMIRAGAIGYVVKGGPATEIIDAVRRAAMGLGHLSAGVAVDVVRELAGKLDREERDAERERDVRDRVDRALQPGAIRPVYQPVVDLELGSIAGVESLARFDIEPQRPPDQWFEDAALIGAGVDLEIAAIRAQVKAFDGPALGKAYVALNVSPEAALRGDLFTELIGLPWDRVVLEVTEHARVDDYGALASALVGFRSAGGRLAIDDAGAGFASLRHILLLDPDIIKLDITLTRDIDSDRRKRALSTALTAFATEMGMSVIAEGIETESELVALRSLGVGFGQGYFLRRPAPLVEALMPIEAIHMPDRGPLRAYPGSSSTGAGRAATGGSGRDPASVKTSGPPAGRPGPSADHPRPA